MRAMRGDLCSVIGGACTGYVVALVLCVGGLFSVICEERLLHDAFYAFKALGVLCCVIGGPCKGYLCVLCVLCVGIYFPYAVTYKHTEKCRALFWDADSMVMPDTVQAILEKSKGHGQKFGV